MIQVGALALGATVLQAGKLDPAHEKAVLEYRQRLETSLKSDTGWLTVAGLHWLNKGETTLGSDPKNGFVLPAGKSPAFAGSVWFDGKTVTLKPAPDSGLQVNGAPATEGALKSDTEPKYDLVTLGDLSFFVIVRGDKTGLRLRDKSSKYRREFTHRDWYPVQSEAVVEGKFLPFAKPKQLKVPTVIEGVIEEHESPGEVEFSFGGKTHKVQVLKAGKDQVWLIFRDKTSGKGTYPAGRFLYGDLKADGKVIFDFNKAYNPPCAFTPYATCPLPPRQNYLSVEIAAGELNYHIEP
jgi:uncharacterized protein (DUF1684 family)